MEMSFCRLMRVPWQEETRNMNDHCIARTIYAETVPELWWECDGNCSVQSGFAISLCAMCAMMTIRSLCCWTNDKGKSNASQLTSHIGINGYQKEIGSPWPILRCCLSWLQVSRSILQSSPTMSLWDTEKSFWIDEGFEWKANMYGRGCKNYINV